MDDLGTSGQPPGLTAGHPTLRSGPNTSPLRRPARCHRAGAGYAWARSSAGRRPRAIRRDTSLRRHRARNQRHRALAAIRPPAPCVPGGRRPGLAIHGIGRRPSMRVMRSPVAGAAMAAAAVRRHPGDARARQSSSRRRAAGAASSCAVCAPGAQGRPYLRASSAYHRRTRPGRSAARNPVPSVCARRGRGSAGSAGGEDEAQRGGEERTGSMAVIFATGLVAMMKVAGSIDGDQGGCVVGLPAAPCSVQALRRLGADQFAAGRGRRCPAAVRCPWSGPGCRRLASTVARPVPPPGSASGRCHAIGDACSSGPDR